MKKEKGSITLFSLVAILLVSAAIFALLEGTRLQEMRRFALLQTESALESAFANYNGCLWEKYRLLGADGSSMQKIVERSAGGRMGSGMNLLRLVPEDVKLEEYTRLTDGNGNVYIANVASYMKENFVYEAAKEIYSHYESIKQILETSQMDTSNITDALEEMERLESSKQTRTRDDTADAKSILETAKYWMELGILELFVKNAEELSNAKLDYGSGILERNLQKGKNPVEYMNDWQERMLLQQYLLTYMSSYMDRQEDRALAYELEYLVGKCHRDIDNLKVTITKLLAIREASNFLSLMSDSIRVAEAETMAILLVGVTANPMLIETVKIGLLTAWALGESILDVRALLAGKKISLLKNKENWTLELESLSELSNVDRMAKECVFGIYYEDYLGILLLLEKEENLAMYAMNLQEATIRKNTGNPLFSIDTLITRAKGTVKYSYKPVFPFLRVIDAEHRWEYAVLAYAEYGYD